MASFHACPRELTDSILEQVSTCDLAAVSLTSKKLHAAATPLLYSRIEFSIQRDNPRTLIHLCRSILKNPELATYVKSVRLRDGAPEFQKLFRGAARFELRKLKPYLPQPTDADGMPEFVSFIAGSGLPYANLWIEKLRAGDLNACAALLLSKLPNLASFRVGYAVILADVEWDASKPAKITGENQMIGKMFQSAAFDTSNHGLSRFQNLQDVFFPGPIDCDFGYGTEFSNPRDVMALLSLRSMRSFSGWCLNPSSFPFTWPAGPPDLAHLTSLSLTWVNVDFLAQVMERTSKLKKLNWEFNHMPEVDQLNTPTIDLGRFVEAIKPCQDTLEDLTINLSNTQGFQGINTEHLELLGSLNGLVSFANIKQFKVPMPLLLADSGWYWEMNESRRMEDSMPPNVEIVTVTDEYCTENYDYEAESEMAKLKAWITETAATRTPKLVEVCLYLTWGSDWIRFGWYGLFERIFERSQVRHRIVKEQEEEEPWNIV